MKIIFELVNQSEIHHSSLLKTLVRRQANDEGTYGFWNPIY